MRNMVRNTQEVWYATYVGKTEITSGGKATGQWTNTYSTPVKVHWNINGVKSDAEVQPYGILAQESLRIVAPKPLPVTETSILWIGIDPTDESSPKHNYIVKGIPTTLTDGIIYAAKVSKS